MKELSQIRLELNYEIYAILCPNTTNVTVLEGILDSMSFEVLEDYLYQLKNNQ